VRGDPINRATNYASWSDATVEKSNIAAATEYLETCIDPSLPVLLKSRRFYAFTNGVYVTYIRDNGQVRDRFTSYDDAPVAGEDAAD